MWVESSLAVSSGEVRRGRGADGRQRFLQKGVNPVPAGVGAEVGWPLELEAAARIQALDDGVRCVCGDLGCE